jgi:hypothetical protein
MTTISQLDRKRPRPELDSPSGPPGSPRPAPPAGTLPRAPDGPPGLAGRRPLTTGGPSAPRAALPLARTSGTSSQRGIPRSTTTRAESTEPTMRGVKLEDLPPVPRIRNPAHGWHDMWRKAATRDSFDPLRLQYQDTLPPPKAISGALFLRQVNELTGAPGTQAFTTARADTTRFTVRIPGVEGPVHLLRRDAEDGTLGDLVRLNTGSDEEIKEALAGIAQRSGQRRKAKVKQESADVAAARAALPGVPPNKFFQSQVQGKAHRQIVDPMLGRYVASTGQKTSRPAFVEKVFLLTASAPRLATDRPDIGHFVVNVPGTAEPVHVLRQETHDGMLANFKIVESPGDAAAVKRAVNAMYEVARVTASRTQYKIESSETKQREFPEDLNDAFEAFQSRPENLNIARTTFLQLLGQWAGKTAGTKTDVEGIRRFTVDVPHYGTVELLGHLSEAGEVVHVQRLMSEGELEHKLRRMVQNAKNSRGGATHDTAGAVRHGMSDEARARNNIWRTLQRQMGDEFTSWNQRQAGYKPGSRAFVAHLERLCAESAGEAVMADDSMSVTRHVVTPNPGGPSFTLLRCTNAAGVVASLRVIDELQTEKQAIAAMANTVALQAQAAGRVKGKGTTRRVLAEELDHTVPKKREDAKVMQRALEGMLANKHAGKANLLDGLDNEAELRTWFREDGSLLPKRTAWSFMGMAGFPAARDAMESLLTRLGHRDVVAAMPPRMDAELLAKVLKARVEHPEANADELMKVIGVPAAVYSRFLSLKTGKLWDPDRIRHLPGYEQHWPAIQDALNQLGHTAQAARQGGVVTDPAKRLAHDIEDDLYALQKALVLMRKEGLSRGKAARRAGVANPALMRILADKQGNVRNLQFIAGRLSGDPSQKTMERLGKAVRQLSDLAERDMVVRTLKGGLRVKKLFVVGITAARIAGGAEARSVRELYADNPELVRKPRSYAAERPRQALRWLSTALRRWVPGKSVEIQTYYDPVKKEVWVSSNQDALNEKLREFLATGGLMEALAGEEQAANHGQRMQTNRTYRHVSKLKRMLEELKRTPEHTLTDSEKEARNVLAAIAEGRFRVPPPREKPKEGDPPLVNLHSELRIRDAYLAETGRLPDPLQLTGTRRPCGTCAKDLDLPEDARRGAFWMSRAARVHHDPEQVADENAKASIPTFITQTRDKRWTEHPNTDSESDLDEPSLKRRAEPARTEPPAKRPAREDGGSAGGAGPVPGRTTAAPTPAPAPAVSGRPQATAGSASGGPATSSASATLGKRHADGQRVASAAPTPQPARAAPAPQAASTAPAPQAASDLAAAASLAEANETQIQALQEDALDAAMLLDRQVDFPVPREEIGPLLQGLLDEGARRFDAFRAQLDANPDARATPEQQDEMRQLGELGLRLRRSAAALGWLPSQAAPTAALPAGVSPPADGNWERPMRDLFIPGTASGARNICWFDTLAQLALDQSRDLGGDMRPVDELAADLRETADRLGLTEAGAMADDDHGALQLIAHSLGLQVHVFLRQPDGQVALSALQSVGALEDRPVHVYSDDTHFEPMWPAWGPAEASR